MHLMLVLLCAPSSLCRALISFMQLSLSILFVIFFYSNVAKLYDWMPFLMPTQYGDGAQYFYLDIISRVDCLVRLESDSPAQEMKTLYHQTSNWYFKKSLR